MIKLVDKSIKTVVITVSRMLKKVDEDVSMARRHKEDSK